MQQSNLLVQGGAAWCGDWSNPPKASALLPARQRMASNGERSHLTNQISSQARHGEALTFSDLSPTTIRMSKRRRQLRQGDRSHWMPRRNGQRRHHGHQSIQSTVSELQSIQTDREGMCRRQEGTARVRGGNSFRESPTYRSNHDFDPGHGNVQEPSITAKNIADGRRGQATGA